MRRRSVNAHLFDAVEERLRQLPGVLRAGSMNEVPLGGGTSGIAIQLEGKPGPVPRRHPGYFTTIGVPFVAGRDFSPSDARLALPLIRWFHSGASSPIRSPQPIPVAIINESMARRLWPDGAVGRRFKVLFSPWITVAGVVRDMRTVSLRASTGPEFYLSASQEPQSSMEPAGAHRRRAAATSAPGIRSAVSAVDSSMPIAAMRTLEAIVDSGFGRPRWCRPCWGPSPASR